MHPKLLVFACLASLLGGVVWAQSATQPLDLKLPKNLPASSASASAPASSATAARAAPTSLNPGKPTAGTAMHGNGGGYASTSANARPAPGVYYGDTSGSMGNTGSATSQCDDSTYNNAQMHGAVSTGVVSGSHVGTGTYEGAEINVTKALGDCDHPTGHVGFSISVDQGQFSGGRYRNGW